MKLVLTFLTLLLTCSLQAQIIEKFSIDNGGDYFSDSSIKVLYTIGEVNVQELIAGDIIVSGGFINSRDSGSLSIYEPTFNQILIFPNPTSKFIDIRSEIVITKIEIFDLLGKQILTTSSQNQIDVSSYQAGIYLIKLYSENRHSIKKFIIK